MASTLTVDNILGATTSSSVVIPNHVLQFVYNTPASGQTMTDVTGQTSITLNNSTTRGTATCSVTRKDANSFFIVRIGFTAARASTAGEMRCGYRIGSGSDVLAYFKDGTSWERCDGEFKDTTTGSVGDVLSFQSVLSTTGSANSYVRHVMMSVMEVAQ
jgi:hypothetical protein|tara:strand:- start:1294 stop:1770 length:477 start_codon:yes stop_codon:yes gene_type:complete